MKACSSFLAKNVTSSPCALSPRKRSRAFGNERVLRVPCRHVKDIILQQPGMSRATGAVHTYALYGSSTVSVIGRRALLECEKSRVESDLAA